MKQIFKERLTKRGVRTFETNINGLPLLIVYADLDKIVPVFKEVSSIEAQEEYIARLNREGLRLQIRGFSSSHGSEGSYLRSTGITEFTEVIL